MENVPANSPYSNHTLSPGSIKMSEMKNSKKLGIRCNTERTQNIDKRLINNARIPNYIDMPWRMLPDNKEKRLSQLSHPPRLPDQNKHKKLVKKKQIKVIRIKMGKEVNSRLRIMARIAKGLPEKSSNGIKLKMQPLNSFHTLHESN